MKLSSYKEDQKVTEEQGQACKTERKKPRPKQFVVVREVVVESKEHEPYLSSNLGSFKGLLQVVAIDLGSTVKAQSWIKKNLGKFPVGTKLRVAQIQDPIIIEEDKKKKVTF